MPSRICRTSSGRAALRSSVSIRSCDRGDDRQEHQHVLAQRGHRVRGALGSRHVVAQRRRECVECDAPHASRKRSAPAVAGGRPAEHGGGPCARVAKPLLEPSRDHRRDRLRQDDRREQPRAQNAERDFLGARHCGVEDRAGISDRGKSDKGSGVAAEHQHVAPRRAIEQRDVQAGADPERDREGQYLGRVDEVGDQDHRHDGAQHGAAHPVDGLRAGRAGERLDGDEDGADGPVGTRQVDPQREEQRQHRGPQDLEGEGPVAPGRHAHGIARQNANERAGARAATTGR